jgi:hypothetical protein
MSAVPVPKPFNFKEWQTAVIMLTADLQAAPTIQQKVDIAHIIHGLCENTGISCSEFAEYDPGSYEDSVQRTAWLANEVIVALAVAEAGPARIADKARAGKAWHAPRTEPEPVCPMCGLPSRNGKECASCIAHQGGDW